jgi:tetratricopeptide (TPR) repeat protein
MKREIHNRLGEAETLSNLGSAYRNLGRLVDGLKCQQDALAIARKLSEPGVELTIANDLATTWRVIGDMTTAAELSSYVLDRAERTLQRYELAKAHDGLAAALRNSEPETARVHWQHALILYVEIGVPNRWEVERNLRTPGSW